MSISILNRGASGGLKPELTVTAPSGSKLEISTGGSGGSGGSANGDGMALYNGVMLPKLPEYDKVKDHYSDILVGTSSDMGLPYSGAIAVFTAYSKPGIRSSSDTLFIEAPYHQLMYLWTDSQDVSDMYTDAGIPVAVGEWSIISDYIPETDANGVLPTWSSYNILNTDGTIYLAASDPIPLDGMNVITWDGDTSGLTAVAEIYKVSDLTPTASDLVGGIVGMNIGGAVTYAPIGETDLATYDDVVVIFGTLGVALKDEAEFYGMTFPQKGVYFPVADGDYVSLLAYPASSGGDKQIVDTYTLGENETEHTFTVDLGTYTVTGTLGEKSKSVDVVIDTVGQYSVEIDYKLWLYREGDECEEVTGGYSKVPIGTTTTNAAATKEAGRWYLDESMYYPNLISNNKINVTPYSKVYADIESTKSNKWHPWIGILTDRNIGDNYRALVMGIGTHGNASGANRQIVSADIAAVTGDYYIGAALTGDNAAGYVYNIWLE